MIFFCIITVTPLCVQHKYAYLNTYHYLSMLILCHKHRVCGIDLDFGFCGMEILWRFSQGFLYVWDGYGHWTPIPMGPGQPCIDGDSVPLWLSADLISAVSQCSAGVALWAQPNCSLDEDFSDSDLRSDCHRQHWKPCTWPADPMPATRQALRNIYIVLTEQSLACILPLSRWVDS